MAEYLVKSEDLTAVADAIRTKGGTDAQLTFPNGFVDAVQAISAGAAITDGIVVKARDADGYATEVDVYGELFDAEFAYRSNSYDQRSGWNSLKIINLKTPTKIPNSCFSWLNNLETITGMENVTEIVGSGAAGTMQNVRLSNCSFPNATYNGNSGRVFQNCPNLETIYLPKVNGSLKGGHFIIQNCPALKTAELGSVGNGVDIGTYAFQNCTQTGLTITIYCASNKADSNLSAIRNYATNATIIIKDSTTGETLVTSTP